MGLWVCLGLVLGGGGIACGTEKQKKRSKKEKVYIYCDYLGKCLTQTLTS